MKTYVVDTHALYWYLIDSPKLGHQASAIFEDGARGEALLILPIIVLVELLAIYEKFKPPRVFHDDLEFLLTADQFRVASLDPLDLLKVPDRAIVPEMHDRLVVAIAQQLKVPCVTRDQKIVASNLVEIVW